MPSQKSDNFEHVVRPFVRTKVVFCRRTERSIQTLVQPYPYRPTILASIQMCGDGHCPNIWEPWFHITRDFVIICWALEDPILRVLILVS